MLPYRTLLRPPSDGDIIRLATQEAQTWLKTKVDSAFQNSLAAGEFFVPGIHAVGTGKVLRIAQQERRDGSRGFLLRLTEETRNGVFEVTLTAIDNVESSTHRDTLLIESAALGEASSDLQVDPPRLVRTLLARDDVFDSRTHVTARPRLMRPADEDELMDAITDQRRSVSVIVAASLGPEYDESMRQIVADLTANTVGVTSVVVADRNLVDLLGHRLPASHQVAAGRVRTFLPGVDLDDPADGRRHRVLGPQTFANAISGHRVARGLKAAFAAETREALNAQPLPHDIRKARTSLLEDLARLDRSARVEERTQSVIEQRVPQPEELIRITPAQPDGMTVGSRFVDLIRRWLPSFSDPITDTDIAGLDALLVQKDALSDTLLEEASVREQERDAARDAAEAAQRHADDLELDLADLQDESSDLRRRVEYLQRELIKAGEGAKAYRDVEDDGSWAVPGGVVELATVLSIETPVAMRHKAFERVEFTGSFGPVEDVQKRDQLDVYAKALWEYVHVLYDYAGLKIEGSFNGDVRRYLTDDVEGTKCSPQRHASTESSTVLNSPRWREERVFPVPAAVSADGFELMDAHFRPTHRDTFAPRMHYFDDTSNTGKIYIGYIGKHLSNTKTSDS